MTYLLILISLSAGALLYKIYLTVSKRSLEAIADKILQKAHDEASSIKKAVADETLLAKQQLGAELRLQEEKYEKEKKQLERRESLLEKSEKVLQQKRQELQGLTEKASLTPEEATKRVLEQARDDCKNMAVALQEKAALEAEEKALKLLVGAIERLPQKVLQTTVCSVVLPTQELKAKIIGRDGKNIKAFERTTGVQLLLDDSDTLQLSSFDPKRRELAKMTLEYLVQDGRINPQIIEEAFDKAASGLADRLLGYARVAAQEAAVSGLHPDIIEALGSMHLYASFGQNLLCHSVEVSHIMGTVADELALDAPLARRIGLLHDIGKVRPLHDGSTHAAAGASFAQACGERLEVVNGIACHHGQVAPATLEGALCGPLDALSAGRPGARLEPRKDLHILEEVALAFPGVIKAYAIHGGRELQVFVRAETSPYAPMLAKDIALKLHEITNGKSKMLVTVVCEEQAVQYSV